MLRLTRSLGIGFLVLCLLTLGARFVGLPVGSGLVAVPIGPVREPVTITIWYGTEKQAWLEAARDRFLATNPTVDGHPIQIALVGKGSAEIAQQIGANQFVAGDNRPTVASPASSIWLPVMEQRWNARNNSPILDSAAPPQPLVLTPLVLVVWEQRAKVLWPNGSTDGQFWERIHDAVTAPNWAAIGGSENWGPVKLGHTSPLLSNSGAQALLLMAYSYYHKSNGLTSADITNADFVKWLSDIEQSVPNFGESTGTFMNDMVLKGPSTYDMAIVYENLVIGRTSDQSAGGRIEQAEARQGQALRIYYPPATTISDHPYAILSAPWVSDLQRKAAAQFRDFLLQRPQQELALEYGFRPADSGVPLDTNNQSNPFVRYKNYGVQTQIGQQVATPNADVLQALLDMWQRGNFRPLQ